MKVKSFFLLAAVAVLSLGAVVAQAAGVDLKAFVTPDVAMAAAGLGGMINFYQDGDVLDLTPSAAVAKGEGYMHGTSLFGIAIEAVASGAEGRFYAKPGAVVTIAKTSALAISVGDRLFWDATNKVVNKTATAQTCVGVATEAAANPSSTVKMRLGGTPVAGA